MIYKTVIEHVVEGLQGRPQGSSESQKRERDISDAGETKDGRAKFRTIIRSTEGPLDVRLPKRRR